MRADHPRSRGVYGQGDRRIPRCRGIIPARAGFTLQSGRGRRIQGDHPRSRGVYGAHEQGCGAVGGSSPLARGLLAGALLRSVQRGIIPARAGFTRCSSGSAASAADHPRSRGVYLLGRLCPLRMRGSSPLARGLRRCQPVAQRFPGIIPARAGFTSPCDAEYMFCRDHPRSRGVYWRVPRSAGIGSGSSPLARGLQISDEDLGHEPGIIPARAGFTSSCGGSRVPSPDHPRSRGVYHHIQTTT